MPVNAPPAGPIVAEPACAIALLVWLARDQPLVLGPAGYLAVAQYVNE